MDMSALRARLASLQNPRGGAKGDSPKTLWSPTVGKHSVRILPSAFDKQNPFKELYFHYEIGEKTMISLSNFGEKDPIVEFAQGLRKSSQKEDWQMAKKIEPKMRVFAPVVVRGEEEKGVMLWGFGKQVFMDLLAIAEDEDVGDYTDPVSGRDITIEVLGKESTGLNYNKTTVRVRTKVTPLSEDSKQVEKWLTDQPNPINQFKKYAYEDIKSALMTYLNPEDEKDQHAVTAEPVKSETPKAFTLETSKQATSSKIDELFDL